MHSESAESSVVRLNKCLLKWTLEEHTLSPPFPEETPVGKGNSIRMALTKYSDYPYLSSSPNQSTLPGNVCVFVCVCALW